MMAHLIIEKEIQAANNKKEKKNIGKNIAEIKGLLESLLEEVKHLKFAIHCQAYPQREIQITSSGFPIDNPTFTSNSPCTFDYDPYYTDGTGPQTTGGTEWAEESKDGPSKERK